MFRNAPERYLFQSAPSVRAPSFTPMYRFVPKCHVSKSAPPSSQEWWLTAETPATAGISAVYRFCQRGSHWCGQRSII
jgi:hypothetical protein